MLIFRLLGDDAEQSFARSWGISYGIGAAAEARPLSQRMHVCVRSADLACSLQWKDIATEALKAAVILAILERLYLTSNTSWLEARRLRG